VSSNISQSYPYGSESEVERAAAIDKATTQFSGLAQRIATEGSALGDIGPADHGAPPRWWVWVCPNDEGSGRLHVAAYARERHALLTVCDTCGNAYLR
jgi:hypothetical protein